MARIRIASSPISRGDSYEIRLVAAAQNFNALVLTNQEKVWNTILDIEEKYQMNPKGCVRIPLPFPRGKLKASKHSDSGLARKESLDFLSNAKLIKHFQIDSLGTDEVISLGTTEGYVDVELDIERLRDFKRRIEKNYLRRDIRDGHNQEMEGQRLIPRSKDVVFEVRFNDAREVFVNNRRLAKLNFDSENDRILSYLFQNANKTFRVRDLSSKIGGGPIKRIHNFLDNLGFKGDLRKMFFSASKDSIRFHNPVTHERLHELGLSWLIPDLSSHK